MSTTIIADIPLWLKLTAVAWPIVIGLGSILVAEGAAKSATHTTLSATVQRVDTLEENGSPVVRERLARIEESQRNQTRTLERMEKKLDYAIER